MTFKKLFDAHLDRFGLGPKTARTHLVDFFSRVASEVEATGRCRVPWLGTFTATTRKARVVRNPVTRELMDLPQTRSVRFRPAKRGVFAR